MKPRFARRKHGLYRTGRKCRACSKLLAFLLASLAAQGFIQPALGQYTCPSSCNGLTLNVGTQSVNSGGVASGTTLNNVAQQGIFAGGVASATTVNSAGGQFVLGGTAVNTTINAFGFQEVDSGTASSVTINPGGEQFISGGTVSGTTVNAGYQEIDVGAVTGTVVSNGGYQNVIGGSAAQTTIYDGLQAINGGTATGTVLSGGTAEQDIYAGSAVNTTVNGGTQFIYSGAVASASRLGAGGAQNVSSGGVAVNTVVLNSGVQSVFDGGVASGTTVSSGGMQNVSSGGAVLGSVILGTQSVYSGGIASNTTVSSGGVQNVFSGGIASATTLGNAGSQVVSNGGQAISTIVNSGGAQSVFSGGSVGNTVVLNAGVQSVFAGGIASSTTVSSGGTQNVSSGGAVLGSVILGTQSVYSGGIASNTTVSSGGVQNVFSGGIASATTLGNAGSQVVSNGGQAISTIVNSGGAQSVSSGGIASSTTVSTGGEQNVASGGVAVNTTVSSGGIQTVSSGGVAQPTLVRQGGSVVNYGTVVFNSIDTTSFDGTLTGQGAVLQQGAGTTILTADNRAFTGTTTVASGTLLVGDVANPNASLGGDVTVTSAGTLGGHGSVGNNVVNNGTVIPGGTIGTLNVGGNYTQTANGVLVVEVSPTSGSQLKVNGTATLGGTLQVRYDPGSYTARAYAILTANAINGKFGALSAVTSPGANLNGLAQSISYSPTEIDLLLAQNSATVPTTIAPLDTSIYTALGSTAVQGALAFDRVLLDRLIADPAIAHTGTRDGTWAALTDGYARADGSGAASSFGAHRAGFAAGYDHHAGRALIGGAIGYEHDEISESTTSSNGRLDAIRLAAYASRMFGAIETSGVFGYSFAWATDKRPLGTGPNGTPEGDHWLQSLSGTAQAGVPLEIARDTVLEPRAGLHWAWLHGQGFTESGGGGQDLRVGADTVHSARPYVGLMLMHAFGTMAQPVNVYVDVEYARELANRTRTVTVFSQDGTAFAAPGASLARHIVSFGAGAHAQISPSWSVSGDASTQLREGAMVRLQLGYRF